MQVKVEDFGKIIIVELIGEFYLNGIKNLESVWAEQLGKCPAVLGIDCKQLEFIDSSAIGTLVKFVNNCDKDKIKMIFLDINEAIGKIFKTAKLTRVFNITSREEFNQLYLSK